MASKRQQMREEISKASKIKPLKKARKKREFTEEQKAALVERMAKARAARGPAKNLSIHESLRNMPDDHPLHPDKVKAWIKDQKLLLTGLRSAKDGKEPGPRKLFYDTETYILNLQKYLQDGIYRDVRYGAERQSRSKYTCVVMAYHADGTPKRSPGVYYPDMGREITNEEAKEDYDRARKTISNKKRVR